MKKQDVYLGLLGVIALGADPSSVVLTAGAAELMYGLREETNDMDISVDEKCFVDMLVGVMQQEVQYRLVLQNSSQLRLKFGFKGIEYDVSPLKDGKFTSIDGVWVSTVESLISLRERLGRDKDKAILPLLYEEQQRRDQQLIEIN